MGEFFQRVRYFWKLSILLTLLVITFSYAMFQGGFVSWFLFYSFLPFSLYALLFAFYSLEDFAIERSLTRWDYHANETLIVKVTLKRNKAFPMIFMIVEDCLSESLGNAVQENQHKMFLFPGFRKEITYEYRIANLPRGEHELQAVRIFTSDLLGLIEKEKCLEINESILVHPAYEKLIFEYGNYYEHGMRVSNNRIQREASMVAGVREYQRGDRFSWINWKASARRNGMVTKEFEQHQSNDIMIIMDCIKDHRFETIVSFTASLGQAILQTDSHVGFLAVGSERAAIPLHSGAVGRQLLFYSLAKAKDDSPISFDKVLGTDSFLLQHRLSFVVVTAQLSTLLIEAARKMTARRCPVTIFVIKDVGEVITSAEQAIKSRAQTHGVSTIFVYKEQFAAGLMEAGKG